MLEPMTLKVTKPYLALPKVIERASAAITQSPILFIVCKVTNSVLPAKYRPANGR
jgi:hypothetical protein